MPPTVPVPAIPEPTVSVSRGQRLVRWGMAASAVLTVGIGLTVVAGWLGRDWEFAALGANYVPMAPSTAWLFVAMGVALGLPLHRSGGRLIRLASGAAIGATCLVSLAVLLGVRVPALGVFETWLSSTTAQVAGIPVGQMSLQTAATFLVAAAALAAGLAARTKPCPWRPVALGLGGTVFAGSAATLLGYALGVPLLYGSGLVPMALLTAVAFGVLGVGLLAAAQPEPRVLQLLVGPASGVTAANSRRFAWALVATLAVLVGGIGTAGVAFLRHQLVSLRHTVEQELAAVAELMVSHVHQWQREYANDANWLASEPLIRREVDRYFSQPTAEGRERLQGWLENWRHGQHCSRVLLLDAEGQVRLAAPEGRSALDESTVGCFRQVLEQRQVQFSDLHWSAEATDRLELDVLAPLFDPMTPDPPRQIVGVLLSEIDPAVFLFPLIETWPTPSRTAETLLVRREGGSIFYLHELRHRKGTTLRLSTPLTDLSRPAVRAAHGREGVVEGIDYRGEPVLAALRRVPDSPWFLVAKIDQAEVLATLRSQVWMTGSLIGALLVACGLGLLTLWRRREGLFARQELAQRAATEARLRASEALLNETGRLARIGGWSIQLRTGELTWTQEVYRIHEVENDYRPTVATAIAFYAPEARATIQSAVERAIQSGEPFELELPLITARHNAIWVQAIGRAAFVAGTAVTVEGTFQDITVRKRAEQVRDGLLADLASANRNLESLLYVASHDLRAPLVNLQGFGQRMEKACAELKALAGEPTLPAALREGLVELAGERIPRALGFIRSSTVKMDALIAGLLRVSRLGHVEVRLEPLAMDSLVAAVVAAHAFQIEQAGAVVHIGPLPGCRGDAILINQVFSNLLDNALKYRDPARALTVTVSGTIEDGQAVYAVADTGVGIAPEHHEKVWEMFHRLHPESAVPGEGLGLNLVRRILDRLGGRVAMESIAGQGSCFRVSLPAS